MSALQMFELLYVSYITRIGHFVSFDTDKLMVSIVPAGYLNYQLSIIVNNKEETKHSYELSNTLFSASFTDQFNVCKPFRLIYKT